MNLKKILKLNKNTNNDYSFSSNKEERDDLCETIITSSSAQPGFYFLLIIATFIVTVGLIKNNLILIIGGMLVAPLLSPILALSLSILILDLKVFWRSLLIFIFSAITSLVVSTLLALFSDFNLAELDFLKNIREVGIFSFLVPVLAGAAASFTWAKKNLSGALPGVAVTVTLLPPLAAMGLAISESNYDILMSSLGIYSLNVLGIISGSLLIFLIMGFHKSKKTIIKQVEIENKDI